MSDESGERVRVHGDDKKEERNEKSHVQVNVG